MSGKRCSGGTFGTTADVGLAVRAPTLEDLFSCAGELLFSAICDRRRVRLKESRAVEAEGEDLESLLVAWLSELIYIYDTEYFLVRRCRAAIRDSRILAATIQGETLRPDHHQIRMEVKAVTYHRLRVWREKDLWRATLVLDV
jgi:SHS2 domain-containing protein